MLSKIALRSVRRDMRRSVATTLAIAIGVAAVFAFCGYVNFVERAVAEIVIYREGNAHIQIYRNGALERFSNQPAQFAMYDNDREQAERALAELPKEMHAALKAQSFQLDLSGIVQSEDQSTPFIAVGVDIEHDRILAKAPQFLNAHLITAKSELSEDVVLLTQQMIDLLALDNPESYGPTGDRRLILSSPTFEGRFNFIEAGFGGVFSTGVDILETSGMKASLELMQSLSETDAVSRMIIQLNDRALSHDIADSLAALLQKQHPDEYVVTTWDDPRVSSLYAGFMAFANTTFTLSGALLVFTLLLVMKHTFSSNIIERRHETGVMRALGFGRKALVGVHLCEALLLGVMGIIAGVLIYTILASLLSNTNLLLVSLPRMSEVVPVRLVVDLSEHLVIYVITMLTTISASLWASITTISRATLSSPNHSITDLLAGR